MQLDEMPDPARFYESFRNVFLRHDSLRATGFIELVEEDLVLQKIGAFELKIKYVEGAETSNVD